MTANEIFATRLKNARLMKGYSMDRLASEMGNAISKMTISKYENMAMSPSSSVIISLSKALDVPVDYFFRPFSVEIESIRFRKKKSSLSVKREKALKHCINDLLERYISIEEICNIATTFEFPLKEAVKTIEDVKRAAAALRSSWLLGLDGIVNVIELLESHAIKVLEIDAPSSFDGLSSLVNEAYPVIVVNESLSVERKRFTLLHELGHLVMPIDPNAVANEEALCNYFASEMLIPESVFRNLVGNSRLDISYPELRDIQLQFGISCDALMYKAKNCGIISDRACNKYFIKKNSEPEYKARVEQSLFQREGSCRFTRLVYHALSMDMISISKAASLLNVSVDRVRGELILA